MNIEKEYVDGLIKKIERLQQERDALAAHVERLRRANEAQKFCDIDLLDVEFAKTPQQCLRDLQAEAGRAGFIAGATEWISAVHPAYADDATTDIEADADEYAATVRKGGAE